MDSSAVLAKTRKGLDELAQRTGAVPQKLRSVLILVDGKTRYGDLLSKCSFIQECSEHLTWLLQNGFLQTVGATPGSDAVLASVATSPKATLLNLARELLGAHSGAVVQRLQDTEDTHDALAQTLERCHKLIRLSIDEKKAEQFLRLGSALLAPADPMS